MAQKDLRLYEAMFLVETNIATDFQATKGMIETIMERAQAELLVCRLWDERRLAYDIDKRGRAAYVLCYFRCDGTTIGRIERDVQLSEHLLRVLVLRADYMTDEQLEQIVSGTDGSAASDDQEKPAGDSADKPSENGVEKAPAPASETAVEAGASGDSEDKPEKERIEDASALPNEVAVAAAPEGAAESVSEDAVSEESIPAESEEKPDAAEEKS